MMLLIALCKVIISNNRERVKAFYIVIIKILIPDDIKLLLDIKNPAASLSKKSLVLLLCVQSPCDLIFGDDGELSGLIAENYLILML